jgi:amino acid adenylation domain-containing protein/thioester reductase-like protein
VIHAQVLSLLPSGDGDGPIGPPARAGADDLAYLIFTSGSIGRPKGVLVTHRGIVPMLDSQIPVFGLRPGSRSLWLLSPAFDASVSDVGTALLSGATLCIEDGEALGSVHGLLEVLERRRITHFDLPPSLLPVLDLDRVPDSLETLIIGGEPSPPGLIRRWAERFRVVNVYGPTEATVCSSLCLCAPESWDQPLLGTPIPGTRYLVLGCDRQPVAPGTPGELFIASPGLARGYLNQPGLTAEKFVERQGERLYRTGDRVVVRGDGAHVFLGRIDRQVKVRGLLVEPEEVEARLVEHPGVAAAAVVQRVLPGAGAIAAGRSRVGLVAFVVARVPGTAPDPSDLHAWLARALPLWMIPQHVEYLDELPRSISGKVDLPALADRPLCAPPAVPVPAPDAKSAALAAVWREVLGLHEVSLSAGFFEQGGDSLALLEAVATAQARGLLIPPALVAQGLPIPEIVRRLDDRSRPALAEGGGTPPDARDSTFLRSDVEADTGWRRFLDRARSRPAREDDGPCRSVFLTGGTGHLGARLMGELLRRTDADIHVLVRAQTEDEGRARLRAALDDHGGGLGVEYRDRVRAVLGDVERPRLGLTRATWDGLTESVDTIFHNAARVNLVLPYASLRAANVLGTKEVLRLQGTGRRKRLHHASTLSVFVASDRNQGRVFEDDDLSATARVYGGYAQTKWAAEWLVRATASACGPTSIYRLGLITGDSQTGRSAPRDFLVLFLRGLARLGCVPRLNFDLWLDVTPVDFAAAAIACLALGAAPGTFHLANPRGLSLRAVVAALRGSGVGLDEVSPELFRSRLAAAGPLDPEPAAAVLALCRALPGGEAPFNAFRTMDLFQATGVEFDRTAAETALGGSGLAWPPPGDVLLARYLRVVFLESGGPS